MRRKTTSFLAPITIALLMTCAAIAQAQAPLDQRPLTPIPLDRTDRLIIKFKGTTVTTTGVVVKSIASGRLANSQPRPTPDEEPATGDDHDGRGNGGSGTGGNTTGGGTTGGGTTGGGTTAGGATDTTGGGTSPGNSPSTTTVVTPGETVRAVADLAGRSEVALDIVREASGASIVVALAAQVDGPQARAIARRIADDPQVEYAIPDMRVEPKFSNDTYVSQQWALTEPGKSYGSFSGSTGGMNVVKLWSQSQGQSPGGVPVRIAVIDTGGTQHADLNNFNAYAQYDFIGADPLTNPPSFDSAADGDGRDGNANDPGDWCASGQNSSWHGTSVAGIIAAKGGNGIGIIGAAPQSEVLQVRALGRCGGYVSDIVDAMRWSVGLPVPGVPINPTPAKVVNLSLGTIWSYQCSSFEQTAVDEIVATGALLVAAAGNSGAEASYPQATGAMGAPANCNGVLAVAAHTESGDLANYSNFDPRVGLTAPGGGPCKLQGGNCLQRAITTLTNSGTQGQGTDAIRTNFAGTSAASPHAAAAAALLFAVKPDAAPQDVVNSLKSTARAWPQGSFCASPAGQGLCGAGMLDTFSAATHLSIAPVVQIALPPAYLPGSSQLAVVASASSKNYASSQLAWQWTQVAGLPAVLTDADKPTLQLTLPARRTTIKLQLRVTDPDAIATFANAVVEVNNPPVPNPMQPVNAGVGKQVAVQLGATDPDGDPIDFALLQGSQGMTVDYQSGVLSWTPGATGSYQVKVAVSDAYGASGPNIEFPVQVSESGGGDAGGGGAIGWPETLALLAAFGFAIGRRARPRGARQVVRTR